MSSAFCGAGKSRVRTGKFNELFDSLASLALPFLSTFGYPKFVEKNFCQIVLLQQLVGIVRISFNTFPARLFIQVLLIFELIKKLKRRVARGM